MPHPKNVLSLVADIGGTNTRVGLAAGPLLLPDTIRRYRNADHPSLETVLRAYTEGQSNLSIRAASVAIAGPVRDGKGTLTNLDWTIDRETLSAATGADFAAVLNDLQAQGHALGRIAPENLRQVVDGKAPVPNASQLVIGVGTGFNLAPVHNVGESRFVAPSEAGHKSLPMGSEDDRRLARFIEEDHGFAAVEEVLSGRGLERVYAWLGEEDGDPQAALASDIMANMGEDNQTREALAVSTFVRILGRVAGDEALDHLPFGGVFLAGGVARAMTPHFKRFGFAKAFRDKGRFSGFMEQFGVWVIEDDYAALTGSAAHLDRLSRAI